MISFWFKWNESGNSFLSYFLFTLVSCSLNCHKQRYLYPLLFWIYHLTPLYLLLFCRFLSRRLDFHCVVHVTPLRMIHNLTHHLPIPHLWNHLHYVYCRCGTVGSELASESHGPWFDSQIKQNKIKFEYKIFLVLWLDSSICSYFVFFFFFFF